MQPTESCCTASIFPAFCDSITKQGNARKITPCEISTLTLATGLIATGSYFTYHTSYIASGISFALGIIFGGSTGIFLMYKRKRIKPVELEIYPQVKKIKEIKKCINNKKDIFCLSLPNQKGIFTLLHLPTEILFKITDYVSDSTKNFFHLSLVSKTFYQITVNSSFWDSIYTIHSISKDKINKEVTKRESFFLALLETEKTKLAHIKSNKFNHIIRADLNFC